MERVWIRTGSAGNEIAYVFEHPGYLREALARLGDHDTEFLRQRLIEACLAWPRHKPGWRKLPEPD